MNYNTLSNTTTFEDADGDTVVQFEPSDDLRFDFYFRGRRIWLPQWVLRAYVWLVKRA